MTGAGLDDMAHDHVVDRVTGDTSPLQSSLYGKASEVDRREALERAGQLSDRGTGTGDDD